MICRNLLTFKVFAMLTSPPSNKGSVSFTSKGEGSKLPISYKYEAFVTLTTPSFRRSLGSTDKEGPKS